MPNYQDIKIIGFDLDQTLYEKSPEIDEVIQEYIYEKISEDKKCTIEEASQLFKDLYKDGHGLSGSQSLDALGISDSREIIQEALERADFSPFLKSNPETNRLLRQLKEKYQAIDLITGSNEKQTLLKLEKLNIPKYFFSNIISSEENISKSDGSAYQHWLGLYRNRKPEEFLYIGDRPYTDYIIPKELGLQAILVNTKKKDDSLECLQLESLSELSIFLL